MAIRLRASNQVGATAAEYALMVGLIAIVIIGAVTTLGLNVEALFSDPNLLDALDT